jgi:phasin family protein
MASVPRKAAKFATSELVSLPTDIVAEVSEAVEATKAPVAEFERDARAAVEKSVAESRAAFASAKISADETAHAIEKSYYAARDGVIAINAKAFEALRANAEANLEFMKAAFAVKSVADFLALHSEFARSQVDALTGQTKDLGALTQKTVAETFEPLKDQVAKSFKIAV